MDHDVALPIKRARRPGEAAVGIRRRQPAERDMLISAALDAARPGLIILDHDMGVRLLTRPAAELLGVPPPRASATPNIMRLLAGSQWLDVPALQTLAAAFTMYDAEPREVLFSLPRPGGTRVVELDLRRAGTIGWVASLTDVTQTRETQDWLVEHASTDPVTGLWNRQHFMLMLRDRLDNPQTRDTAVLMLDLKRFKPVNDTLGTEAGDALLRLVGNRLSSYLRDNDHLARFASDEFAIMVGGIADRAALQTLISRLAELIARPFMIEGQLLSIGSHIGAACAPQDGDTPDVLVANAVLALSAARSEARGLARIFEPQLDEQARTRRALETDLRRALSRGEFELFYQPQVDLRRGRVTGMEALLRWRHPQRGLVSPAEFIPLIEELGLIGEVGAWVLRDACREAAGWPAGISVAVNASPLQVEAGGFAGIVAEALTQSGLPGHRLEIEITENLLLRDNGTVTGCFQALRALGVHLVLDDFGTGYASLSQLARFHFDKIKIDRGFISAPDTAAEHAAIVRAIAALGISLTIPTTAEGVETQAQLDQVRADGCTSVQGYFYSKPVPASEVARVIARLDESTLEVVS